MLWACNVWTNICCSSQHPRAYMSMILPLRPCCGWTEWIGLTALPGGQFWKIRGQEGRKFELGEMQSLKDQQSKGSSQFASKATWRKGIYTTSQDWISQTVYTSYWLCQQLGRVNKCQSIRFTLPKSHPTSLSMAKSPFPQPNNHLHRVVWSHSVTLLKVSQSHYWDRSSSIVPNSAARECSNIRGCRMMKFKKLVIDLSSAL